MSDARFIQIVIDIHPKGCVFLPGAAERIAAMLPDLFKRTLDAAYIERVKIAFQSQEVYCPHEPGRRKQWC